MGDGVTDLLCAYPAARWVTKRHYVHYLGTCRVPAPYVRVRLVLG